MDEVTADVDEEVTKQDYSSEPLPEPLLIILSPPPPFLPVPGEPTMIWHKWLKAFEHYVEALGESDLVDSTKCMLLQNCLGPEGQRIFTALIQSETTYASAISALTVYFNSNQSSQMYRLKFHQRAQMPGETRNFAFPEDLNKHLEIHVKENNGTCSKCDETFSSPEELEKHMEVHNKTYACSICGKKFKVEYALKKHEQGHQDEQYYCSLCRKHFMKLSHYKRHVMVHNRREARCPHCDSVFLKLTALKYHLRTHTEERPYQCTCCIETFEEKEDLEQHCLKHRKFKRERPYSCTRCDAAFSALIELTDHMSSHEGEQPLNCPVCGRTFLNKTKLEKHLSIHTGERPHLCSICGNGFPSAASLKLHAAHGGAAQLRVS
ncbi:hypothetical protein ABVT39_014824 [Epinephelus coioides]